MVADNPNLKRGGDGSIRAAKRDELAARAMEAMLAASPDINRVPVSAQSTVATGIAHLAYLLANAMLAEGGRQR